MLSVFTYNVPLFHIFVKKLKSSIALDLNPQMYYNVLQRRDVIFMAVSVRLSEKEDILIRNYARLNNISVSELFRRAVLEKIEDEIDLKAYEKAMEEYKKNPVTYTHEEVAKMLGLE